MNTHCSPTNFLEVYHFTFVLVFDASLPQIVGGPPFRCRALHYNSGNVDSSFEADGSKRSSECIYGNIHAINNFLSKTIFVWFCPVVEEII